MTPQEYLERIDELLEAGQEEAILELGERYAAEIHPQLSNEELAGVHGVFHGAIMAVKLEEASKAHDEAEHRA